MKRLREWEWVLAIPVVAKIIFYVLHTPQQGMDGVRFLIQAESLLAGNGYPGFDQVMVPIYVSLPPGYPVFIAALYSIWHAREFLLLAHLFISIASCYLVYYALRPRTPRLAVVALVAMSISPAMGRLMLSVLSETFAIFLASLAAYLLSRDLEGKAGAAVWAGLGFVLCALALTSPVTVPLTFAVMAALVWNHRRQKVALAALLIAWLIPMVPWQLDCVKRTGRIQPTVFYELPNVVEVAGIRLWHKTWSRGEQDLGFLWSQPMMDPLIPESAFASVEQRERLAAEQDLYDADKAYTEQYNRVLREAANEQIAKSPLHFYVLLPLRRAFSLWFETMPGFGPLKMELLEVPRQLSLRRWLLFFGSWLNYAFYSLQPVAFLFLFTLAVRSRNPVAWAIAVGTLFYTGMSGWTAMNEERRNYPFYPLCFVAALYVAEHLRGIVPKLHLTRYIFRSQH